MLETLVSPAHAAPTPGVRRLRIDFISDITCPWCAIGLVSLEQAIAELGDEIPVELHLQPFELKHALLVACHRRGENPALHEVLLRAAAEAGLDPARAAVVLAGDDFAAEVRATLREWQGLGIASVPSVLIDRSILIQGGHPPAAIKQLLRQAVAAAQER